MSPSKLKLNEPYISIILIQSAPVWTVFHSICNVIHRLLCKEFWSQGIWLRPGCRSSGSLPVKPEALTHLRPTSAPRYHRFQILWSISRLFYSVLSLQLQAKSNERGTNIVFTQQISLCVAFDVLVLLMCTLCIFKVSWLESQMTI